MLLQVYEDEPEIEDQTGKKFRFPSIASHIHQFTIAKLLH